MSATTIEWTDRTWNPTRGCSRVSEGCRNCYAERVAARFSGDGQPFYGIAHRAVSGAGGAGWTGRVELIESKLVEPLRWSEPQRVFVNSMSDLFHEALSDCDIARVFAVMMLGQGGWSFYRRGQNSPREDDRRNPRQTFQVLTKRPQRMRELLIDERFQVLVHESMSGIVHLDDDVGDDWRMPLPNVWLGVSVEDQATADERIPLLLSTPAAVRFVSYEPALGPVDFTRWLHDSNCVAFNEKELAGTAESACICSEPREDRIDWIIVGGESGPGARPFDLAWARKTIDDCAAARVACFVKQLGAQPVQCRPTPPIRPGMPEGALEFSVELCDRKGGDMSEWPEGLRCRQFPRVSVPT